MTFPRSPPGRQLVTALTAVSLLAGSVSLPVLADCVAPQMIMLPKGAAASLDDMLAAQKAVKTYNAAVQEYLNCVGRSGGNPLIQDKALRTLRSVADQFNEELRTFKAKNGA